MTPDIFKMQTKSDLSLLLLLFISFNALLFFRKPVSFVVSLQYLDAFIERNTWGENLLFFLEGDGKAVIYLLGKEGGQVCCVSDEEGGFGTQKQFRFNRLNTKMLINRTRSYNDSLLEKD